MSQQNEPNESQGKAGGAESSLTTGRHTYICLSVPTGCTTYAVGLQYELVVSEPPPNSYTLPGTGPCAGATFTLDE